MRRRRWFAAALALAAALAAGGLRLVKRRSPQPPPPRDGDRAEPEPAAAETAYTCECGAEYRVSGTDRHRIYWPADAPESEPVLGDRCVSCDAPLAATPRTSAARSGDAA